MQFSPAKLTACRQPPRICVPEPSARQDRAWCARPTSPRVRLSFGQAPGTSDFCTSSAGTAQSSLQCRQACVRAAGARMTWPRAAVHDAPSPCPFSLSLAAAHSSQATQYASRASDRGRQHPGHQGRSNPSAQQGSLNPAPSLAQSLNQLRARAQSWCSKECLVRQGHRRSHH